MKGGALFFVSLFLLLQPVVAYDQHSTHPSLTYEMAQFFNTKSIDTGNQLSINEIQWLKQGAVEEDEPARWINHFYDPVHNVGWSGKHLGNLSQEEGYQLGGDIAPRHSISSVDWVTNQEYQAAYGRQYGNQTWQKAVKAYINGNTQSAFIALGHVLHLVEDATVPDHVRDDSHPGIEGDPGSPYEVFSKVQTDQGELNIAEDLLKHGAQFKQLISINQAIKDTAIFTNENFFSEDTLNNDDFLYPNIKNLDKKIEITSEGERVFLSKNKIYLAYFLVKGHEKQLTTADSFFVLPSYRDHLFPEAVLTGASVINLFFQEVEKYKQNPGELESIVPDSRDSFLVALKQFPKRSVIKACGVSESTCKNIHNSTSNVLAMVGNMSKSVVAQMTGSFGNLFGLVVKTPVASDRVLVADNVIDVPVQSQYKEVGLLAQSEDHAFASPVTHSVAPHAIVSKQEVVNNDSASVLGIKIAMPNIMETIIGSASPEVAYAQAVYGGGVQGVNQAQSQVMVSNGSALLLEPIPVFASSTAEVVPIEIVVSSSGSVFIPTSTITSSTEVILDMIAPSVPVLSILNQSGSESLNIVVQVTSTDVISALIYYDIEFSTNTVNWQILVSSTVSAAVNFSGIRGQEYYFRSRAIDVSGNQSDWSQPSPGTFFNWSGEVVLNEIAWAGTASDLSAHEWFELYNNTSQDIDLSNWKIFISGKPLSISKIFNKVIAAHGYYLFERSSDNTVKEIAADATFSGSLNNNGEKIEILKPDNSKSDEVDASIGWFAGDTTKYRSMERLVSLGFGNDQKNWQSNQGFRETGRTANGGPIYGSPKRANIGFINLNWDQDEEVRTLTKVNNPYILQYYSVPVGKKLIVEPGVVIKSYFNNANITVLGTLETAGTANEPVVFTSGRDLSLYDDRNNVVVGAWPVSGPSAQDWQGVWFKPGSVGMLHNAVFRYAGKNFVVPPMALPVSQALRFDGAHIDIANSVFTDNGSVFLFAKDSTTTITNTQFSNGERAMVSENSDVAIRQSSFSAFTHAYGPLYLKDKWPLLAGVTYSNNAVDMPYLENVLIENQEAVIGESQSYLFNMLRVSSSAMLSVQPGASIYVPLYGILEINGSLNVLGTADQPVQFLAFPSSSNWGNIRFNNSTSTFQFVHFKQGNRLNGRSENVNGMILANNSHLTITDSSIWDSEANAIQSNNSIISITNSSIGASIKNNNTRGIKSPNGVVNLDNVNFTNLAIGIESGSSDVPQLLLDIKNMSSSSFNNVDYFWQPLNVWSLPLTSMRIL